MIGIQDKNGSKNYPSYEQPDCSYGEPHTSRTKEDDQAELNENQSNSVPNLKTATHQRKKSSTNITVGEKLSSREKAGDETTTSRALTNTKSKTKLNNQQTASQSNQQSSRWQTYRKLIKYYNQQRSFADGSSASVPVIESEGDLKNEQQTKGLNKLSINQASGDLILIVQDETTNQLLLQTTDSQFQMVDSSVIDASLNTQYILKSKNSRAQLNLPQQNLFHTQQKQTKKQPSERLDRTLKTYLGLKDQKKKVGDLNESVNKTVFLQQDGDNSSILLEQLISRPPTKLLEQKLAERKLNSKLKSFNNNNNHHLTLTSEGGNGGLPSIKERFIHQQILNERKQKSPNPPPVPIFIDSSSNAYKDSQQRKDLQQKRYSSMTTTNNNNNNNHQELENSRTLNKPVISSYKQHSIQVEDQSMNVRINEKQKEQRRSRMKEQMMSYQEKSNNQNERRTQKVVVQGNGGEIYKDSFSLVEDSQEFKNKLSPVILASGSMRALNEKRSATQRNSIDFQSYQDESMIIIPSLPFETQSLQRARRSFILEQQNSAMMGSPPPQSSTQINLNDSLTRGVNQISKNKSSAERLQLPQIQETKNVVERRLNGFSSVRQESKIIAIQAITDQKQAQKKQAQQNGNNFQSQQLSPNAQRERYLKVMNFNEDVMACEFEKAERMLKRAERLIRKAKQQAQASMPRNSAAYNFGLSYNDDSQQKTNRKQQVTFVLPQI